MKAAIAIGIAYAAQEVEADGLLATCLQHEIDHLDGVLFVDHIAALKRKMGPHYNLEELWEHHLACEFAAADLPLDVAHGRRVIRLVPVE